MSAKYGMFPFHGFTKAYPVPDGVASLLTKTSKANYVGLHYLGILENFGSVNESSLNGAMVKIFVSDEGVLAQPLFPSSLFCGHFYLPASQLKFVGRRKTPWFWLFSRSPATYFYQETTTGVFVAIDGDLRAVCHCR